MNRIELGSRMLQWHSNMGDPIYAVGSFYIDDEVYPDKEIVDSALSNFDKDFDEQSRMLKGEKVSRYNDYYRTMIHDQRNFAGYTDEELQENVEDLTEIVANLGRFLKEDY